MYVVNEQVMGNPIADINDLGLNYGQIDIGNQIYLCDMDNAVKYLGKLDHSQKSGQRNEKNK